MSRVGFFKKLPEQEFGDLRESMKMHPSLEQCCQNIAEMTAAK